MEQNENVFVLGANLRANKCYPRLFKNNFPKLTLRIEALTINKSLEIAKCKIFSSFEGDF